MEYRVFIILRNSVLSLYFLLFFITVIYGNKKTYTKTALEMGKIRAGALKKRNHA